MKIAMISKSDSFGGGASKVAEELVSILDKDQHTAHHYCSWSGKGYGNLRQPLYGRFEGLIRRLHTIVKKIGFPELIPFELPIIKRRIKEHQYDLVHFHDLSSAISPLTLINISKNTPVIWTIHDCSPFTGGCLYPMDCEKFKTTCFNCPQAGQWPIDSKIDLVFFARWIKKQLHKNKNIHLITPSQWMADIAYSSGMLHTKPTVISNGVDIKLYKELDKKELKDKFNIPQDRFTILLSAGHILDERKGTKFAIEIVSKIKDLNPYLILVGTIDDKAKKLFEGMDYYEAGYLSTDKDLNEHYSAADIFLFCSLADNQPLSILETMASGTPLIGFKTGGIPEMVEQNKTGYLVAQKDLISLENIIRKVYANKDYIKWGKESRRKAELEYSYDTLLKNHTEYYHSIINN
ncbi:MAG: glycosyl transferase group 1 [Epsilonproteobacteria bacterium]|nr:MAG: glycosyl transferase group 1 [Campylobacterota bacterium]